MQLEFFLDVDGTLTDGRMIYSKEGKTYKSFGADDFNALEMLSTTVPLHFISADKKGFAITHRRIEAECGYDLDLVPGDGLLRWKFMQEARWNKSSKIIYMGDGILDWYPLSQAYCGITTCDALDHVKNAADYVVSRSGGNRAVAEACIYLQHRFELESVNFEWNLKTSSNV